MNFTNRLVNPTPYDVTINWHAGIDIKVPADGHVDLSAEQSQDFRAGLPGSESVQELMKSKGLFVRDIDRSYESQAVEALEGSSRILDRQHQDFVNRLRQQRASQGISENPEAFEEIVKQFGHADLRERVKVMKERARFLRAIVDNEKRENTAAKIDPDRTIPFTDPPKIFDSPVALQMFLRDNVEGRAELKERWQAWHKQVTAPKKAVAEKAE